MVSKRTLQPVADIAEQAERISGSSLHERVPVPKKRDEIHSLATTMNDMLGRLESSQNRFREFVSDASHELRNPVATSIARLEATLAHPTDSDWDETVKAVLVEQQRLAALVDELLVLARLDEHNPRATTDVDLDDILLDEASRVDNVKVDTSKVKPSRVQGDRRLLQRAIRNLLDNARRYASTTIWVTTARRSGTVTLTIEDDGPGIGKADREKVFERFYRPDEARSREHGGAGLGLAIVRSVVTQSGGHVDVSTSRHGGAKFRIVFP
jgi:signal transduction histidine kinase